MMIPGLTTTMTGGQFIFLYLLMFLASAGLSYIFVALVRPAGRAHRIDHVDQLALLSGKKDRISESAVARLMTQSAIYIENGTRFRIDRQHRSASPVEATILSLPSPATWAHIKSATATQTKMLERALVAKGLIVSDEQMNRLRWVAALPLLLLAALGAIRLSLGVEHNRPVGILVVLLIATVAFAATRWFALDRRTQAGITEHKLASAEALRLRTAPLREEMGMAVALFGTVVLAGSAFDSFHKMRTASSGDGSSSDSGDGGCGGGGCGGCGG